VDALASSEEQAVLWVKGVAVVLEAAEMQKSSRKVGLQAITARPKAKDDDETDRSAASAQPSLPTISQSQGQVREGAGEGLLDVAAMRWERIQVGLQLLRHCRAGAADPFAGIDEADFVYG
jgi:hypothetical protein